MISGVVCTFQPMDPAATRDHTEACLRQMAATVREPLMVLTGDDRLAFANPPFAALVGTPVGDLEGGPVLEVAGGRLDQPGLRDLLRDILPRDGRVEDFAMNADLGAGGQPFQVNARRFWPIGADSPVTLVVKAPQ